MARPLLILAGCVALVDSLQRPEDAMLLKEGALLSSCSHLPWPRARGRGIEGGTVLKP